MSLAISLFGSFDVRRDDQAVSEFRSQSVRALLAYLAIEADRPHEREHLCALLWPHEPLPTALTNLRQALHRLRQAIEPAEADAGRHLLISRQAVRLNPAGLQTDVARFQATLAAVDAHRHRSAAGCARCAGQLRAALGAYRGELLAGFSYPDSEPFSEWLHFAREQLHGQVAGMFDSLAAHHERRGELAPASELLRRWTQIEPWSEPAQLRLVAALARAGQRAQALRQYERYKAFLRAELRMDPGQNLVDLIRLVRAGALPTQAAAAARHFPSDTTPFIGRAAEIAQLCDLLDDPACRLLTLTGIGGSGKTRLAIEAARDSRHAFADGALFVPLASIRHARQLPEALSGALEFFANPGRPLLDQLIAELRGRELLLVLDNCEQVADLAQLLARMLADLPQLSILATSRIALGLRAEWAVPVAGMRLPAPSDPPPDPAGYPAGQLFLQVARQVQPAFPPGPAEAALVLACCRLLGGSPLGIELAASQLRARQLSEIVAGVRADIASLSSTMGDLSPRHRSLRVVFDWSWRLLNLHEQQSLAQLAAFIGGCERAAALAVCGPDAPLDQLVASSLLQRDGEGRYWLHEQTRQFAEEQLHTFAADEPARARHGTYYLGLAAGHAEQMDGPRTSEIIARLQIEHGNLRQAWIWAARSQAYDLIAAAAPVFQQIYAFSDLRAGVEQFSYALDRIADAGGAAAIARKLLLDALIMLLRAIGQPEPALRHAHELLAIARAAGDQAGAAIAMHHLADLAIDQSDFSQAWGYLEQANALGTDDPSRQSQLLKARALLKQAGLIDSQQLPVDLRFAEQAYAIYCALEMPAAAGVALNRLGNQHRRLGDYGRSIEARVRAVALIADQGEHERCASLLNDLGEIYILVGCYAEARATFERALAMARRIGAIKIVVTLLEGLARSMMHLGDPQAASDHIAAAFAMDTDIRYATQTLRGYYLTTRGYAQERAGDWGAAWVSYHDARRWWEQSHHRSDAISEPLAGLARVALARQQPQAALSYIEELLPFLERAPLQDALEPMWVHWSCYQALSAAGDGRAAAVLAQAAELLRRQAAQISDPALRGSFLSNVIAHRAIIAAASAAPSGEARLAAPPTGGATGAAAAM